MEGSFIGHHQTDREREVVMPDTSDVSANWPTNKLRFRIVHLKTRRKAPDGKPICAVEYSK